MDEDLCSFAHSANDRGQRHELIAHLLGTAQRAREFGEAFGQADACHAAGLWHDIGKVSPEFQGYLRACEGPHHPPRGPDHKAAGAALASASRETAHLAPLLLGHHGGIPDLGDASTVVLAARRRSDVTGALEWARRSLPPVPEIAPLPMDPAPVRDMIMRLVFSALVDADFLDTELHFDTDRAGVREAAGPDVAQLDDQVAATHAAFLAGRPPLSRLDGIRALIRERALEAAALRPGLFRLTVPTGGGKTRAGLAFALRHCRIWGLRRLVVAVPYLTITDQTAAVFRDALGETAVLEHHSGIEEGRDGDGRARLSRRLAAENWDAPVIVTTTVQLFESLFSNRPSRLRKVHRLARSVVILDEAQALPLGLLGVTLDALAALTQAAQCSVVFCTATQPALEEVNASLTGEVREIIPEFAEHFAALRRVTFSVPARAGTWTWDEVAAEARTSLQTLVIVNRRRDAIDLLDRMPSEAIHLSTLLCGAHRRRVLRDVVSALAEGGPCLLIATQVVEAGVDVDFPLVLRALAPFDSVVQAAGRCNREARRGEGRCIVFRPEAKDAYGTYRRGIDTLDTMLQSGPVDFNDPVTCQEFYRHLYGSGSATDAVLDPKRMRAQITKANFESMARTYRLIDEPTEAVVVLYPPEREKVERLIDAVAGGLDPARARLHRRLLQPYVVALRPWELDRCRSTGNIEDRGGLLVWCGEYDMRVGVAAILDSDGSPAASAEVPHRGDIVL